MRCVSRWFSGYCFEWAQWLKEARMVNAVYSRVKRFLEISRLFVSSRHAWPGPSPSGHQAPPGRPFRQGEGTSPDHRVCPLHGFHRAIHHLFCTGASVSIIAASFRFLNLARFANFAGRIQSPGISIARPHSAVAPISVARDDAEDRVAAPTGQRAAPPTDEILSD